MTRPPPPPPPPPPPAETAAAADEVEALVRERLCKECTPEKRDLRVVSFMRRFDIDNDGVVRSRLGTSPLPRGV